MKKVVEYIPEKVEFVLDQENTQSIPETLGEFKNVKEVQKFFNTNQFITMNPIISVVRLMDSAEVNDLRGEYISELEESLPQLKRNAEIASQAYENAKDTMKAQNERVSASETKVQMLVDEINAGVKEMNPEQSKTFEIAYNNQYLYYTLVNGSLELCKIKDIPDYEKSEIFNSEEVNLDAFKKIKKLKTS